MSDYALPRRPREVVSWIAVVGVATPYQVCSAQFGMSWRDIPTHVLLRYDEYLGRLARQGYVERFDAPGRHSGLRPRANLYKLNRMDEVPGWADDLVAGMGSADNQWFVEHELHERYFANFSSVYDVRHRLKKLVSAGVLGHRDLCPKGALPTVWITEKGIDYLQRYRRRRGAPKLRPTRVPRLDQIGHHLLCVETSLMLSRDLDAEIKRLWGDEDLRSRVRKGRRQRAGSEDEKLADGLLHLRGKDGTRYTRSIEILSSKYTDEDILAKYEHLSDDTIYVGVGERLAERTENLVGQRPIILPR